jgi:hypothetical protein
MSFAEVGQIFSLLVQDPKICSRVDAEMVWIQRRDLALATVRRMYI